MFDYYEYVCRECGTIGEFLDETTISIDSPRIDLFEEITNISKTAYCTKCKKFSNYSYQGKYVDPAVPDSGVRIHKTGEPTKIGNPIKDISEIQFRCNCGNTQLIEWKEGHPCPECGSWVLIEDYYLKTREAIKQQLIFSTDISNEYYIFNCKAFIPLESEFIFFKSLQQKKEAWPRASYRFPLPRMIKNLKSDAKKTSIVTVYLLGESLVGRCLEMKKKKILPALIETLQHKGKDMRHGAAYYLGKIGDKRSNTALMEALRDKDEIVQLQQPKHW